MAIVLNHHTEPRKPMRMDISQIIVAITFVIYWYAHFTYDFVTPFFQYVINIYNSDSTLADYMRARTLNLNEARRLMQETTVDRILDFLIKVTTAIGGFVFLIVTPIGVELGKRGKIKFFKWLDKLYTKHKKPKRKNHDDIL